MCLPESWSSGPRILRKIGFGYRKFNDGKEFLTKRRNLRQTEYNFLRHCISSIHQVILNLMLTLTMVWWIRIFPSNTYGTILIRSSGCKVPLEYPDKGGSRITWNINHFSWTQTWDHRKSALWDLQITNKCYFLWTDEWISVKKFLVSDLPNNENFASSKSIRVRARESKRDRDEEEEKEECDIIINT